MRARLGLVLHWLASRQPDIVLLQELKLTTDLFPYKDIEEAGYSALVHGQKSWNGVAILIRQKTVRSAEVTSRGLPYLEEQGARLISARIVAKSTTALNCTSVYVPNGRAVEHTAFKRKLAFLDGLSSFIGHCLEVTEPQIIGGDFNLCPGALDTFDEQGSREKIFHTTEERTRFAALLDLGMVDLFRKKYPELQSFSWWDYRSGNFHKNIGLRIDLILGDPKVFEQILQVTIDRDYRKKKDNMIASDHAPVVVALKP